MHQAWDSRIIQFHWEQHVQFWSVCVSPEKFNSGKRSSEISDGISRNVEKLPLKARLNGLKFFCVNKREAWLKDHKVIIKIIWSYKDSVKDHKASKDTWFFFILLPDELKQTKCNKLMTEKFKKQQKNICMQVKLTCGTPSHCMWLSQKFTL